MILRCCGSADEAVFAPKLNRSNCQVNSIVVTREEVVTVGLDIANQVFRGHIADAAVRAVFSPRITRGKLVDFF